MIARASTWAAALTLVAVAGAARADVTVVKGAALRGGALAALADAERAMVVCWRGSPPARVRVAVAVEGGGAVTASAITAGGAAQCAAGVLAVWTVPGGAWKGELEIGSRVGSGDLAGTISKQLAARGEVIRACQAEAPSARGPAIIRMKVHPEGELTDVTVTSKLGAALDRCVKAAVSGLRLDPLATADPVAYELAVTFSGARTTPTPTGGTTTVVESDDGAGSVSGPLAADAVEAVLRPVRSKLAACLKGSGARSMVVRFTIRADGTSKNVAVKEATGGTADEACLKKALAGVKFGTAADETKVVLPLAVK